MPPAAVTRAPPAAATTGRTASRSQPPIVPSRSTCVNRKPPTVGASWAMRSSTETPVLVRQPSTTTSPPSASTAAITRSRGRWAHNSALAAVPRTIFAAPASSHARAASRERMPPPTRHGARRTISRIRSAFEPSPRAASRSTTATSPTTANSSRRASGSPPSSISSRPCRSCTARPLITSMLATIIAAARSRGPQARP